MSSSTGFRSPRFATEVLDSNPNNNTSRSSKSSNNTEIRLSHILSYTRNYQRQSHLLSNHDNDDDDHGAAGIENGTHSLEAEIAMPMTMSHQKTNREQTILSENSQHRSNGSNIDVDGNKNANANVDVDISRAIRMLEPHLKSFRQSHEEKINNGNGNDNDDNDDTDLVENIPSSLIRVARFFPFKWIPIKKALLRPPPISMPVDSEVEVDITTRLSLVNALFQKGILAGAEMCGLQEACEQHKQTCHDELFSGSNSTSEITLMRSKKRRRRSRENDLEMDMYDKIRIAFSRLPIDLASSSITITANNTRTATTANTATLRHLRTIIDEYCTILEKEKGGTNYANNNGGGVSYDSQSHSLPPLNQVADWALVSFSAVVVSNGFEDLKMTSEKYLTESSLVAVLQSLSQSKSSNASPSFKHYPNHSPSCSELFSNAMIERLKELMEPRSLEQASNLNYLCLVRYISYLPLALAEELFRFGIYTSFHHGCSSSISTGMSCLPKLLASFVSVAASHRRGFQYEAFEISLSTKVRESTDIGKQQEILSFFDLISQSVKYLLKNHN